MATGGVSDLDQGTDETFDFLCSMCQGQNKNTEAEHFCADCSDYYCSTHVKFHEEVPALKNHKILNKAQFMHSSSAHFPAIPTERCRVHGHKTVDMFCRQHDSVGCATCMVVCHSDCREKFYVPDYIKNNTRAANPNTVTLPMDVLATSVADCQKELIKQKDDLKSSKEKSLKQIQKWRIENNSLLDELEKKTIQEMEQRFQSLTDKIETALKELQDSTTEIQSTQDSLKSAVGNMPQMFVSIKMANEVVSLVQEKVNTTQSQVSSTEISFVPHLKLQSLLKEMQALGDISQTENLQSMFTAQQATETQTTQESNERQSNYAGHDSLQQITETQTGDTSSQTQTTASVQPATETQTQQGHASQSKPSLLRIKGKKRYTIKEQSDRVQCDIYSACTLDDGSIILVDISNNKLKLVDSKSFSVTGSFEVPDLPRQVCAITDQEVAVCCSLSQLIKFVSIEKKSELKKFFSKRMKMQKTRQINTGFACSGLAYANGKLFVSNRYTSMYVFSLTGDRLQHFRLKDHYGRQIFSDIRSLAVSSDHSNIYVADNEKGLIILDRNGQPVGQYNGPEVNEASGVCLYKTDMILVGGRLSNNVLQCSLDGKLLDEVVETDGVCQTLCCNKDNTKLVVGLYHEDEIEVYNIN